MARALALPPPMDYSPVEGYDDLGFFGNLLDADMLKTSMIAAGGGALGGVVYEQIVGFKVKDKKTNIERDFFDKPWKKMLLAAGFGLAGARALWGDPGDMSQDMDVRRDLAKGHLGAMGSALGISLVELLMKKDKATGDAAQNAFQGFRPPHQLSDVQVETEPSFADVEVEVDNPLGGGVETWIS